MMPTPDECDNGEQVFRFKENLNKMGILHKNSVKFKSEIAKNGKDMFHVRDMSVTMFLISCLPLLLCLPSVSSRIFDNELLGRIVGYAFTAAMLFVRPVFQAFVGHLEVDDVANYMRLGLLAICFALSDIFDIAILGTRYAWVLVFVLGGVGITCIFRLMDKKRFKESNEYYDSGVKEIEELNKLTAESEKIYKDLVLKADTELAEFIKQNGLKATPIQRKPWFIFERAFAGVKYSGVPTLMVDTDFKKEFTNECSDYDKDEHHHVTYIREVHSQDFGWRESDAVEVKKLIDSGKAYPYFGYGLPEFSPELSYKYFRHQWDVTVSIRYDTHYDEREVENTAEIKAFSEKVKDVQDRVFGGEFGKALYELGWFGPEGRALVNYFEERVKAVGEEIPGTVTVPEYNNTYTHEKNSKGDEVGAVLAYTPDGQLVGVYSGNSTEAIYFTSHIVRKELNLKADVLSQPVGEAQERYYQWLYFDKE